jgi:hypothetical protein
MTAPKRRISLICVSGTGMSGEENRGRKVEQPSSRGIRSEDLSKAQKAFHKTSRSTPGPEAEWGYCL